MLASIIQNIDLVMEVVMRVKWLTVSDRVMVLNELKPKDIRVIGITTKNMAWVPSTSSIVILLPEYGPKTS